MNLLTAKEVMDKYHYSKTVFYRRRKDCLLSDYSDAVILDGNQTLINDKRWFSFIKQQSDKKKRQLAGLE